jgi:MFS family permease
MFDVLSDRTYRHLFSAQVVALLGTGLATIALSLLAYDLGGHDAGRILGTVLAIKMVAFVVVAPLSEALLAGVPRRVLLVSLDVVRAVCALGLPLITEVWHVYLLVFVLQSASAAFTPAFQATLPEVLPDETRYTQALALSRLAYELENIASPGVAAVLLWLVPYEVLFTGTSAGFLASALLIVPLALPWSGERADQPFLARTTRGVRRMLTVPRLRGLLALSFSAAAVGAVVIVDTVVLVRADLGLDESAVAITLGCFGAGAMVSALLLPRLLQRVPDRAVMFGGASLAIAVMLALAAWVAAFGLSWLSLVVAWVGVGAGFSAVTTPSGRLLRRTSDPRERPALFAAHFSLSHACWLVTYPLAGWALGSIGVTSTLLLLGVLGLCGLVSARLVWPASAESASDCPA